MRAHAAAVVLAAALCGEAAAQVPRDRAADMIDFGADKNKQELEVTLPPYPSTPANLIRYDPGRPTTMMFYVDSASVSVLADGIIRYTSVVKGEGSQNVSYEGIRCDAREIKIYAYGRPDGTWSPAREPQWKVIRSLQSDGHRYTLYQQYFCPSRGAVATANEAVHALRRGGHQQAGDMGSTLPVPR